MTTTYYCHRCGYDLEPTSIRSMLWCRRCEKRRKVPTHPALVVVRP